MDDEARQNAIRDDSDRLVDLLGEIRGLEEEKRTERFSTPRFHELADQVEDVSKQVWQVAEVERREGNAFAGEQPVSIDDVDRDRRDGS